MFCQGINGRRQPFLVEDNGSQLNLVQFIKPFVKRLGTCAVLLSWSTVMFQGYKIFYLSSLWEIEQSNKVQTIEIHTSISMVQTLNAPTQ